MPRPHSSFVSGSLRGPRHSSFFYGWTILLALSWTELTSWGILYYGFSVFVAPLGAELGWSSVAINGAFSLSLLCSGIAAVWVGRLVDRHGPRPVMTAGSIGAAGLLLAWAAVGNLAAFYLIWVGLGVAMAATLYEPAFAAVATWFVARRARALTILTFVAGLASVVYIPLIAWLIGRLGWRGALVALAAILAVATIPPHALLLRRRPQDLGLLPDGAAGEPSAMAAVSAAPGAGVRAATRSASFRWLTVGFCLALFANVAVTVHLIPFLLARGHGAGFAATAAGLVGIMALPGRLIFTPLGGIWPRRYVTAAIFALQAVALAVLLTVRSEAGVFAFVALFGAGFGVITPARASLVAELYGARHYGSIAGILAFFVTGARALAPVSAGFLYTVGGRYEPVFWALAAVALLATAAILPIERGVPAWEAVAA
jgi:MFS family permease